MGGLATMIRAVGVLTVMVHIGSAYAGTHPANKELESPINVQSVKEATSYEPSKQIPETVTVAYAPSGNLRFGVGIKDYSATEEILQLIPSEMDEDTVEFNAGFTYPAPTNSKAKFYLNYSMLGASVHPALQDKSSQKDYYMDQQAKLGIKLEF